MMIRKIKKILSVMLAAAIVFTGIGAGGITARADSCGGLVEKDLYWPGDEDVIKDPALHWAIRSAMNSVESRISLTEEIVGNKQVRHISYAQCAHPEDFEGWVMPFWIENLEGLQYATSAQMIEICYTDAVKDENGQKKRIQSLSPLSPLTQLQLLYLKEDGITDISALNTLVNLEELNLFGNDIENISAISGMTKLKKMVLDQNDISDFRALENLESLEYLSFSYNQASGLPDMSKLSNVSLLHAAHNQLTNDDVKKIASLRKLRELDLGSNPGITDLRPLARLIFLEKENTVLPGSAQDKENLFAAIEVNKLFNKFNISKMKPSDSENVGKALEAYDALTADQKTYFDAGRIKAARDNKARVDQDLDPVYYEEYDEDGEEQPTFDRLEISVVDKTGKPIQGASFVKTAMGTKEYQTDKDGMLSVIHSASDANWDLSIAPKGDAYVSIPEKIEYEVKDGKTYAINGKRATGFEKLQFVLIPKNEYVDKNQLEAVIKEAETVEEEYKYTVSSYSAYKTALQAAKAAFNNADATQSAVNTATENLRLAYSKLTKTNILTALKIHVVDQNGNDFARPFKIQIYVDQNGVKKEAWATLSDAYTSTAYIEVNPLWADGKQWKIVTCYEEPYEFNQTLSATVGSVNGQKCYTAVNGKSVGPDFEITLKATPQEKDTAIRKPDATVLREYIASAKEYSAEEYTEATMTKLQTAIAEAEGVSEKAGAAQEEYNAAVAKLLKAEKELEKQANNLSLEKEMNLKNSYSKDSYTTASWDSYEKKLEAALEIFNDKNATQDQVDQMVVELKAVRNKLVLRADKTVLKEKIAAAEALNRDDYESGFDELQRAIQKAKEVDAELDAVKSQVDEVLADLQTAIDGLKRKPVKVDYSCYPGVFRALVTDKNGNPVSGVRFIAKCGNVIDTGEDIVSNENGVIEYHLYGDYKGKTTKVMLSDPRYTTDDEHWFTADSTNPSFPYMLTIDGEDYRAGMKFSYVVELSDSENPNPDPNPNPGEEDNPEPKPDSADLRALKEQIDIADSMRAQKDQYTKESYQAMVDILTRAKQVYQNEEADASTISEWTLKLRQARENLKKAEKPVVSDKNTIRILVKDAKGKRVMGKIPFAIYMDHGYPIERSAVDGVFEYEISTAESGVNIISVYPESEVIMVGGKGYLCIPQKHEFSLYSTSYEVGISKIDGEELNGSKEVVFTLSDQWNTSCFAYEEGIITGFSDIGKVFIQTNPNVILPEKTQDNKPVTEIAAGAFENCGLKSVKLPASLTTIGARAFAGNELSSIKVPAQLSVVAKDAFVDNQNTVTLESDNQTVLEKLYAANLTGVSVKDISVKKPEVKPETKPDSGNTPVKQVVKVSKIKISGISKKIAEGKQIALKATVSPSKADNKKLRWKSSNMKIATVNSKGVVTLKKKTGGKKVTITAQATDGSGVKATYVITSMKGIVKSIKVTGAKTVKAGKSLKLKAAVSATKGANKTVIWSSSNTKYAKVSASGKVTAYKAGKGKTVKITAKATDGSNKKKTVTIKVK